MSRRRTIIIDSDGGDVVIDLSRLRGLSQPASSASPEASDTKEDRESQLSKPATSSLVMTRRIRETMELRAESSFRPRQDDFEIIYALSGKEPMRPDTLHRLASHRVVEESDPDSVIGLIDGIIEEINDELGDAVPRILIILLTHPAPGNVAEPSSADRNFFKATAPRFRAAYPKVRVLFGVHAISRENIRMRETVSQPSAYQMRWTSITREHEIGFFDEDSAPLGGIVCDG